MSTIQIEKVCELCGSDKIRYRAFAGWDVISQAFDLVDFDPNEEEKRGWCGRCEAFTNIEDQRI